MPEFRYEGTTALVTVVPRSGPQDAATSTLVGALRKLAPGLERQTGADLAVTGQTAVAIDVSDRLGAALLPFVAIMFALSRWAGSLVDRMGAKIPLVVGPLPHG